MVDRRALTAEIIKFDNIEKWATLMKSLKKRFKFIYYKLLDH